jgi:hypothetical protein
LSGFAQLSTTLGNLFCARAVITCAVWWNGLNAFSIRNPFQFSKPVLPTAFSFWDAAMRDERTAEMVRLRDVLDNYQGELERLLQERTRLDARILPLQHDIRHVARMVDVTVDDPITQLGLTDAIRYVIQHAGKHMTPVDVRDELLKRYCDPEDYRNLLASVHTVMKRLERAGEIKFDGTKAEWTGGFPMPLIGFVPSRAHFRKN